MKQSLGSLAEGTIVPMLEHGSRVNYIVAKHNYQSGLNGTGHTMLVRAALLDQKYAWEKPGHSYRLPQYAKYEEESQLPDVLERYYQSAFDELTLACCKPVTILYSASGVVTSAKKHRFFVPSEGDFHECTYQDGDVLSNAVQNVLLNALGSRKTWMLRTTSYTYDTKYDPETNSQVKDGDDYGVIYIAQTYINTSYPRPGIYPTDSTGLGNTAEGVLPCIVMDDRSGVGEDGVLRGNREPELQSYYLGTGQVYTKHKDFRVPYMVHDADGDEMLVTELLDGKTVLRSYTPKDGEINYVSMGSALLPEGESGIDHTLTIRVTDGAASAEKEYLFRMTYELGYVVYIGRIAGNSDRSGYYWTERHVLHNAADESAPIVLEPEVTLEKNDPGSFVFTVPADNPYYGKLGLKNTVISVEEDGNELFTGYITQMNKAFDLGVEVTCEGELGYLQDRDCIVEDKAYTVRELMALALIPDSQYGSRFAEEGKSFNLGTVTVEKPESERETKESKSITDCWSLLSSNLAGSYGGYLRLRKNIKMENGVRVYRRYLDYMNDIPDRTEQVIQFGVNLLDLSYYSKSNTIVNSVIVMGYETKGWWFWAKTNPITVMVQNEESIKQFGLCQRIITVDGTSSSRDSLRKKGLEELQKYNYEQATRSITINAADLVDTGVDTDRLEFLKKTRVISEAHGVKDWILCTREVIPLDAPEEKEFCFGDTANMTALQAAAFGTAGRAWQAIQTTIKYMNG